MRESEMFVGKVRLLTEEHPDWQKGEPAKITHVVPDIGHWTRRRATNHLRFKNPAILANWLRLLADDIEVRQACGTPVDVDWIDENLRIFRPLPKLPAGWVQVAALAFEVAANSGRCWHSDIGGVPMKLASGLARRYKQDTVKPDGWQGERLNQRPLWHVEMETGFTFLAQDSFWRSFGFSETWKQSDRVRHYEDTAKMAVREHLSVILALLSESEPATVLESEPIALRRAFNGIGPKQSPSEAGGKFIKNLTKLAMEAYDRLDGVKMANWFDPLPGFIKIRDGG